MHEMSICESLIQVIEEQAKTKKFNRVKTVFIEVGPFAGIEIDALKFCFDIVCRNTLIESAKLEVLELPGKGWCFECQQEVNISDRFDPCPICNGFSVQSRGGDELRIKELEVY
ncbi:hydrogenase maturation nickel metallochaperone HypA [Reinekea marinisedimentorum]|uniref:Hydrogenase maturation factor HypA n=1 Tax=Reinekea marinisedimentorum TaxID=230495 RepID=A0A4R3HW06_9GAMM|nr:hydrogenase maturation nickel metallochaperone HypA [Reinekea marinisedimentorum]TCS36753.1 hydrogenase nickel incorporation protein HypA/HybF [Reinekea marinisedimentorum]